MKEVKEFRAESKELLNLVINSIYTNKEIFLRELISNASDAIDKYRYLALTSKGKIAPEEHVIRLVRDEKKRTLTISDDGIGMTREDLEKNLGTIAQSGSKDFAGQIKDLKEKGDLSIIGRFGIGFYSAFMVAAKVEVLTKTLDGQACRFVSDGVSEYTLEEAEKETHGTDVIIHLRKDEKEEDYSRFTRQYEIESLVKKYSDYIRYPIRMDVTVSKPDLDEKGEAIKDKYHDETETHTLNSMIPLWKKNRKEVTKEDLSAFYKANFQDQEDPLLAEFIDVDGLISYHALVFIPAHAPYDLYSSAYEKGLDLYANGVFIMPKCKDLIPDYLKFVRGVVDSDDFSLNISREMLQSSPLLRRIETNVENKIIDRLKDLLKNDREKYEKFFRIYGSHLKFGIYSTYGAKKDLLQDTLLFDTLKKDKPVTLAEFVKDLPAKKDILYAAGKTKEAARMLPQIERYRKSEEDVLLFTEEIDEFAIMMLSVYDKHAFKNITTVTDPEATKEEKERLATISADNKRLLDNLKEALKDDIKDVIISNKLVDSPVSIATREGLSLGMEDTLNAQAVNVANDEKVKAEKVLELNPDHPLFEALKGIQEDDELTKKYASVLYDEAMLAAGFEIKDRQEFLTRLNELMVKALKK